ncbi:methyltransferase domain-containing protein [Streptomyces sp. NPDC058739]|uniref:methyltransferase domain-containing protein n=1 Tax=Streptomyces sp. NPDC058739 TaxID=3346618 RepID=UPI0036C718DF
MTASDFLTATRVFYDAIAEDYADRFLGKDAANPLDRALLAAYAELVTGPGQVADLGCGPGRLTAHLAGLGLDVYGLDLSASMLAVARRENPALRFEQGSMLDLDVPEGRLAGIVSWYSSIHTPVERLPALFAGFRRALAPGAPLLMAFQAGDVPRRLERPFGHPVTLDFLRRRPEAMAALLAEAGFAPLSRTLRERDESLGESTPQAFLIAVRSD